MGVGVTGDWAALRGLIARLDQAAGATGITALAKEMGEAARTELMNGFRAQRDPYGQPWAPLQPRSRRRGGMILSDTGRLRNSFAMTPSGTGFRLGTAVKYAALHQYGASYTSRARFAAVRKGRFLSHVKARRSRSKRGIEVRFIGPHKVTLPARPMLPDLHGRGLGSWSAPLEAAARGFFSRLLAPRGGR